MASMADHLRSQEYARMRRSKTTALVEPQLPDEVEERLVEVYERNDTSASDYLAMVTESRPFTPSSTTHAVIIDSGTYCSTMAMPVVFNSFLQDHGNPVVEEMLSRFEILLVEKAPMGGILIHVCSSEAERKLVGQEIVLLGRKFKIKRQSPLVSKFYLDIFGVGSAATANELFMSFADLGAMPLYLTPRDVNMDAHATTPTWRFYFGQEEPPSCLMVRGFVTNQLVYGRKMYIARGRRSLAPPERAVSFQRSPYAVVLPLGSDTPRNVPGMLPEKTDRATTRNNKDTSHCNRQGPPAARGAAIVGAQIDATSNAAQMRLTTASAELVDTQLSLISPPAGDFSVEPRMADQVAIRVDQSDIDMDSAPSDDDVEMARQMESGFKRTGPSFADENPYDALDMVECEFDAFEPTMSSEIASGVLMIPRLTSASHEDQGPLPTKKRSLNLEKPTTRQLKANEAILATAVETELESHEDRVSQSMQHLDPVHALLCHSKNMDEIVKSIKALPMAWSTALCCDLAEGSANMEEIASLHLLDRILAHKTGTVVSFHQRVVASQLPLGKSRNNYVEFLKRALEKQPAQVKNQWEVLRLLSAFELLTMATCPFLFGSSEWLAYLVDDEQGQMIPHAHMPLLTDSMLLKLLRSRLGHQLIELLVEKVPECELLAAITVLSNSNLSPDELPILTSTCLSPNVETISSD